MVLSEPGRLISNLFYPINGAAPAVDKHQCSVNNHNSLIAQRDDDLGFRAQKNALGRL